MTGHDLISLVYFEVDKNHTFDIKTQRKNAGHINVKQTDYSLQCK